MAQQTQQRPAMGFQLSQRGAYPPSAGPGMAYVQGHTATQAPRQGVMVAVPAMQGTAAATAGAGALETLRRQTDQMVSKQAETQHQLQEAAAQVAKLHKELSDTRDKLRKEQEHTFNVKRALESEREQGVRLAQDLNVLSNRQVALFQELTSAKGALAAVDGRRLDLEKVLVDQNNHCVTYEQRFAAVCQARDDLTDALNAERNAAAVIQQQLQAALDAQEQTQAQLDRAIQDKEHTDNAAATEKARLQVCIRDLQERLASVTTLARGNRELADASDTARREESQAAAERERLLKEESNALATRCVKMEDALQAAQAAIEEAKAGARAVAATAAQQLASAKAEADASLAEKDIQLAQAATQMQELRQQLAEAHTQVTQGRAALAEELEKKKKLDAAHRMLKDAKDMLDKELANAQAQAKRTKAEVESALRAAADQQEHWCKQVDDLRAARDAALQGKDAAVALAVKAKEAEKAAELRTYQSQNAAAFEQLNKQCKASEAAKVKLEVELSKLNEQHAELQVKASAAVERGDAATATAESLAVQVAKLQTVVAETREAAQQAAKDAAAAAKARDVQHKEQLTATKRAANKEAEEALAALRATLGSGAAAATKDLQDARDGAVAAAQAAAATQALLEGSVKDLEERLKASAAELTDARQALAALHSKEQELAAALAECSRLRSALANERDAREAAQGGNWIATEKVDPGFSPAPAAGKNVDGPINMATQGAVQRGAVGAPLHESDTADGALDEVAGQGADGGAGAVHVAGGKEEAPPATQAGDGACSAMRSCKAAGGALAPATAPKARRTSAADGAFATITPHITEQDTRGMPPPVSQGAGRNVRGRQAGALKRKAPEAASAPEPKDGARSHAPQPPAGRVQPARAARGVARLEDLLPTSSPDDSEAPSGGWAPRDSEGCSNEQRTSQIIAERKRLLGERKRLAEARTAGDGGRGGGRTNSRGAMPPPSAPPAARQQARTFAPRGRAAAATASCDTQQRPAKSQPATSGPALPACSGGRITSMATSMGAASGEPALAPPKHRGQAAGQQPLKKASGGRAGRALGGGPAESGDGGSMVSGAPSGSAVPGAGRARGGLRGGAAAPGAKRRMAMVVGGGGGGEGGGGGKSAAAVSQGGALHDIFGSQFI